MPLTPNEARSHRADKYKGEFDVVCRNIDDWLVQVHHWPNFWFLNNAPKATQETIQKIINIYQSKGWIVEYIDDHRNGMCLRFEEEDTHPIGMLD